MPGARAEMLNNRGPSDQHVGGEGLNLWSYGLTASGKHGNCKVVAVASLGGGGGGRILHGAVRSWLQRIKTLF